MALYIDLKIWDGQSMRAVGQLEVLRDRTDDPRSNIGNYTVERRPCETIGRIKGFDRTRGAWALAEEALKLIEASQPPPTG